MDTTKHAPLAMTVATMATVALQKKLGLELDPTSLAALLTGLGGFLVHHWGVARVAPK